MSEDSLEALLALARADGSEESQAKLLSRVAAASSLALILTSTRAALALEMKLVLSGKLVPWGAGLTKAGLAGGVLGAAAGLASETTEPPLPPAVSVQAEPVVVPTPAAPPPAALRTEASAEAPAHAKRERPTQKAARLSQAPLSPHQWHAPVLPPAAEGLGPALTLLERTRGAIARGDGRAAIDALAGYPDVRGDGTLDPEAKLLEIVANRLAGRTREAKADAEQWLRDEPTTPFADALRAVSEPKP